MKKILLSILTLTSLTGMAQWAHTANYSAEDCITYGSKVFASSIFTTDSLRVSTDEGFNWAVSNSGIPSNTALNLACIHNGTLMVAFSRGTNKIYTSTTGASWTAATTTAFGSDGISGICSIGGSTLLACVSSTSGILYTSTNNGATWAVKSTPVAGKLATCIEYMNGNVFIGYTSNPKLLISTNAGASFTTANTGIAAADSYITALGNEGTNLYCGTYFGKIYRSTNAGATWSQVYSISASSSYAIFVNDFYAIGTIMTVASDTGFVYTTNGGTSWTQNNAGFNLGNYEQKLLRVTSTSGYIQVASQASSGRIMRRPIAEIVGIKENFLAEIKSNVYPNPSNGNVTIEASELTNEVNCEVKVYDLLGRENGSYNLVNGKAVFTTSNLNTGIYSYSVLKDKAVVSKGKLVVQ